LEKLKEEKKVELIDEIIQYFGAELKEPFSERLVIGWLIQERQSIYPIVANEVQEIIDRALYQMHKKEVEERAEERKKAPLLLKERLQRDKQDNRIVALVILDILALLCYYSIFVYLNYPGYEREGLVYFSYGVGLGWIISLYIIGFCWAIILSKCVGALFNFNLIEH